MFDLKDTASFMYTCNDSIFYLGWFWGSNASVNSTCAQPPPPPRVLGGICPPCQSRGLSICISSGQFFIVRICSSAGVVTVLSRVLTVGATPFSLVLTVQASMLLAFSRTLTVGATLFSTVLTIQATMLLAFSRVLTV